MLEFSIWYSDSWFPWNHLFSFSGGQSSRNIIPVDHIENGFNVVQTKVFVLQVVGMFPNVDTQQWHQTFEKKNNFYFAIVIHFDDST